MSLLKPNKKKTVCMLLDNTFTRDNRVKREAKSLQEAGYDVHIFAVVPDASEPAYETFQGVHVHRIIKPKIFHYYKAKNLLLGGSFVFKIRQICKQIDIIHVHDSRFLLYGYLLKLLTGARLVYDSHEYWDAWITYKLQQYRSTYSNVGSQTDRRNGIRYWQTIQNIQDALFKNCDAVISVSPSICQRLHEKKPKQNGNRPVLLRNTPYYLETHFEHKPRLFHQHFNLPPETKVLLYQGGIEPTRGIDRIVNALRQLNDIPVCLILMGPVQNQEYMHNLECRAPVGRFFYKEGVYTDDYLKWTASADVGVVATLNIHDSYYFSMPNKLFEYIQAGVPVINPDFPDSAQLVDHYHIGLNFDMESVESIAKTIRTLVTDPLLYERLRENTGPAKQDLCWEKEQANLLNMYQSLA